jgi:molybdopterin biosynthesis enzyme
MSRYQSQRVTRLAPLSEIQAHLQGIAPVAPRSIAVETAAGCVLAADAVVPGPVPPSSVALRDGWAVRSDNVADASAYAPLPLAPGPEWVEAGDPLPHPADAVLGPDDVTRSGHGAEAVAAAVAGEDVLGPGDDASFGCVLRHAADQLRATDVAVLSAAGITRIAVREPRVRIVRANDRIGETDDFVSPLIARAVEAAGGQAIMEPGRPLTDALRADDADAVVGIGGTGMGRRDSSVRILAEAGQVDVHGMGIRPGETAALGHVGRRPVLLLPGRIDAALAIWLTIGKPLLMRLAGGIAPDVSRQAVLTRKIVSTIGLAEVVLVGHLEGGIEPLASKYFPLQGLARADGWVLVAPELEGYPPGATLKVHPLP